MRGIQWWYNYKWRPMVQTEMHFDEQLTNESDYDTLGSPDTGSAGKAAGLLAATSLPPLEVYKDET